MKLSLKNKSNVIIASILVATFFLLHYNIYPDKKIPYKYVSESVIKTIPIIASYTDAPLYQSEQIFTGNLYLCEHKRPSYLNPFRKVEYRYQEFTGHGYGECGIVIEQAESIFSSNIKTLIGNPEIYYQDSEKERNDDIRTMGKNVYANLNFFIFQYLIIIAFVFFLLKPVKSK
ncbi:hypothetical protein A2229_03875 [Candidatus Peregrinibacteria bacterium RIFOXYA2_FULL_33_7]|nr:MAG: hypothetical protein A2229_03875 [Candidatus Peregrinibacteria bacterium RIFOXYA2_FULL_33_7]